jgi:threonine/homoserine/homoserine lactone efflux protein
VSLQILPLAITMMAGPQIMSAIIFVTHRQAVRVSLAFLAGVAIATVVGVAIARGIMSLIGSGVSFGGSKDNGSAGTIIQVGLVVLLLLAALRNWRGRATAEPPRWLGALLEADTRKAFMTGLLVILLMPSDLIIMLTVGANLQQSGSSVVDALPFVAATVLVAALPLLGFLVFHHRAMRAMPKLRDWMNENSWLVNIIVCAIFIVLVLAD